MTIDAEQKERWLREFRLNGFLILRHFLPRALVEGMYRDLHPILSAEHEKALRGESRALRGPGRMAFDTARYADLLGGPLADDRYRRNPVIEELVEEILSPLGSWVRGWNQVECVWRGSEYMTWHSDQTPEETPNVDEPNRTVRVTYNIPLVDFTWKNGAIEFLPGSHLLPRSFLNSSFLEIANLYPVAARVQRGDAILRDGNTLHRGTPNLTDQPRPMLDQTYKLAPSA